MRRARLAASVLSLFLHFPFSDLHVAGQPGIVSLELPHVPRRDKEALLILPGLSSRTEGVKDLRLQFSRQGYDLFIPSYIGRESLAQCVDALDRFTRSEKLPEYGKVHVFSYILGAWTLNRWIRENPDNNIATIVYDRSPLQERAAFVAVSATPWLTRWVVGRIVEDFSKIPYEPIPNDHRRIGIIIESRATKYIRRHRKAALSPGEPNWDVSGTNQACDDHFYTLNNHDEMYHDFSTTGREVLRFIREGTFSPTLPRTMPAVDPFAKERPKEVSVAREPLPKRLATCRGCHAGIERGRFAV